MREKTNTNFITTSSLPLMERFYTIQGEGYHSGKAAYFIRLAGCDVGCVWCDVKESWDAEEHPKVEIDDIISSARESKARIVVVTGGEPLMYDLTDLSRELKRNGFSTHLETSGAYPVTGAWDWICLSPKKFKMPLLDTYDIADEIKVIIYNKSDFFWGEELAARVKSDCKRYLQPEWSRANKMLPQIVEYVKDNPQWEISLQVHKFMNIP